MFKQILISKDIHEKRTAFLLDSKMDMFFVERLDENHLVGNIYKARADSVVPGIQAAFMNLGTGKNGFLYISDILEPMNEYDLILEEEIEGLQIKEVTYGQNNIEDIIKKGQEILVEVTKEPFGSKGARLTTHISLPGRYLVFMPYDNRIGISKKIESAEERKRLKEIIMSLRKKGGGGYIVRTVANGCQKRDLIRDLKYLNGLWQKIKNLSEKRSAPALIHSEMDLSLRVIRDIFAEDINQVVVDDRDEYKKIHRFLSTFQPNMCRKVVYYKEAVPLFEKFKLEKEIEKIFQRKIELKSGGGIVIDPTEALVAIDVNTGKFTTQKSLEETVFITNLEAAEEVAKQIKLRDLGGIVIVDFIDMKKESHKRKVLDKFRECTRDDKAKIKIYGFSELGLVTLSRQRMRRSLESVSYEICPYCIGKGLVKSEKTMSIQVLRKMQNYLQYNRKKSIELSVHPIVAKRLKDKYAKTILQFEKQKRITINIIPRKDFHIEDVNID